MKYFAYGSNMNPLRMVDRQVRFSNPVFAVLPGFQLVFNKVSGHRGEGYANIVKNKKGFVEGVLYEISEKGFERLDFFEGAPEHYKRMEIKVIIANEQLVDAITYVATKTMTSKGLYPKKNYLRHLLVAGKHFLTKGYFQKLKETKTYEGVYGKSIRLW